MKELEAAKDAGDVPKPGRQVSSSKTGRPEMALLDLMSRRHMLRILWGLYEAPRTFRALQEWCGKISPTLLNKRLHELRETRLVVHERGKGYTLSALGTELAELIIPLGTWSRRWAKVLAAEEETRAETSDEHPDEHGD